MNRFVSFETLSRFESFKTSPGPDSLEKPSEERERVNKAEVMPRAENSLEIVSRSY
jgi:hypothetical protein